MTYKNRFNAFVRTKYSGYKYLIKKSKHQISCNLSFDEYKQLLLRNCERCGSAHNNVETSYVCKNINGSFRLNKISTIDLLKPKSIKNCRTLCKKCFIKGSERAYNQHLFHYKKDAKNRNLKFDLSQEQFKKLILGNCVYCNAKHDDPKSSSIAQKTKNRVNGIDRINSSIGYTFENCQTCCKICNFMKSTHSEKFFLEHIQKILNFRTKP